MARLKLLQRTEKPPYFRLTKRDGEIIKAVYEYRALTTSQIEALFFPRDDSKIKADAQQPGSSKTNNCRHRLKLLYHAGYLWRDEIPTKLSEGRKPLVYRIDKKALEVLPTLLDVEPEEIDWHPKEKTLSELYLEHLLKTNDVRVAITVAARSHGFEVKKWLDDRTLKSKLAKDQVTITGPQGGKIAVNVIPDGYFHLWTGKNLHHFLEVDLRTVTGQSSVWGRRDWARKVKAYLAYYNSDLYEKRYNAKAFRILTVTTTQRRLNTLKEIPEGAGGKHLFWFTTFEQLSPETTLTAPIWKVASKEGSHVLVW